MGVRPVTVVARSWPGPRAGTVTDAGGIVASAWSGMACWRSSSARPPSPAATPATVTPPARSRNERRDQSGIARSGAGPTTRAGSFARFGPTSQPSTQMPTATEIAAETAVIAGDDSGSRRVARKPMTPNSAKPIEARPISVRARIPRPAPMASATMTMNTSSASLSLVPNRPTMRSLAPGGWRSMTSWPMPATSEPAPARRPARSSEVPRAAAAAAMPPMAARDLVVIVRRAWQPRVTARCRRRPEPGPGPARPAARRPAAGRTPGSWSRW